MKDQLHAIHQEAIEKIKESDSVKHLQDLRVTYLGKKGSITKVLRGMGSLSKEERPVIGDIANKVRESITENIDKKKEEFEKHALEKQLESEAIDVTLPGRPIDIGGPHFITSTTEEIENLFIALGYEVRNAPQTETDNYNAEPSNLPTNHRARDMQDTFYLTKDLLLRT